MFRFAEPVYLYLLFVIPILVVLYYFYARMRRKNMEKYGQHSIVIMLAPNVSTKRMMLKFILLCLAYAFLVLSLSRPQFGSKIKEVKTNGVEIVVALDVSNSMLADDLKPDRLSTAKLALSRLVDRLRDDRLGLVVFAGDAYTQLPITSDFVSAKMFFSSINPNLVPQQGTALGKAIELGVKSFSSKKKNSRVLIVISDGENHEDDALEAAKTATSQGITIHTIGIGSPNGAPVPIYERGVMLGYRKDKEGNTVMSKLNEEMLADIAKQGNGVYVKANYHDFGLYTIYNELEKLEKKETESTIYSDYEDRFYIFLWISLILLIIEFLLSENKSVFVQKFKLFRKENLIETYLFKNKSNH